MERLLPRKILARFTARARRVLFKASAHSSGEVGIYDLARAVAAERGSIGANVLASNEIGTENLKDPSAGKSEEYGAQTFSRSFKRVLKKSLRLAADYGARHVGTEHILAALLSEDSLRKSLSSLGGETLTNLESELELILTHTAQSPTLTSVIGPYDALSSITESPPSGARSSGKKERRGDRERKSAATSPFRRAKEKLEPKALDYFTEDLIEKAGRRELDPLIGRASEVERILSILSRRSKNNPILIGEAGVGKTAIVHGFAQRIRDGSVPGHLAGRRLLSLDLGLLIAGTVFRGEFEGRLKDVIREAEEERAILFIDEVHTVVGAGAAQGSLDAANILKPAIVRGSFQIIGATTTDEYRRSIEKDSAFERRFQAVMVKEPNAAETLRILCGLKKEYERYHGLEISSAALERTVWLAERFLPARSFPDKAIDILDEAAASCRVRSTSSKTDDRASIAAKIERAREQKETATFEERYEEALRFRNEEEFWKRELGSTRAVVSREKSTRVLTESDIERAVSQMTGVATEKISSDEKQKLLNLEKHIREQIVGQDRAVRVVAAALRRARSGIKDAARPIGSFLFVGPTGVGKSELARVLAETFFEDENAFFRLDMSEFAEPHAISKLLGAPAGYVGYEDAGAFVEFVRRRPYCLILFDEVEKAHPHVQNILLQILENGELTDAQGVRPSFRHSLIILTANIAGITGGKSGQIGFATGTNIRESLSASPAEIYHYLRPELVSRLDDVVVFEPLKRKDVEKIVGLELGRLAARLAARNCRLSYGKDVLRWLAERSESDWHGARKVRGQIQKLVEEPLAQKMIAGEIGESACVALTAAGKTLQWQISRS